MHIRVDGRHYDWPAIPRAAAAQDTFLPAAIGENPAALKLLAHLSGLELFELRLEYDIDLTAIWCFQQHLAGLSFAPRLLQDIRKVQRALQDFHRDEPSDGPPTPTAYSISAASSAISKSW